MKTHSSLEWMLTDRGLRAFAPPVRSVAHATTELLEFIDAVRSASCVRILDELPDLIWAYPVLPLSRQQDARMALQDASTVLGPVEDVEEMRSLLKLVVAKWLLSGYKRAQLHAYLDRVASRKEIVTNEMA